MMDENPQKSQQKGLRELGPAWITAIATLIGAVGSLGFFAGRSSTPAASPQSASPQISARQAPQARANSVREKTAPSIEPPSATETPSTQSLVDMTPVGDTNDSPTNSPVNANAKHYNESLNYATQEIFCGSGEPFDANATYQLNRKYRTLTMKVGLSDDSPSGDTATFSFFVDGRQEGPAPTVGVGQPQSVDLNVSGALRVTLKETCSAPNAETSSQANVTAVWLNPVLSP